MKLERSLERRTSSSTRTIAASALQPLAGRWKQHGRSSIRIPHKSTRERRGEGRTGRLTDTARAEQSTSNRFRATAAAGKQNPSLSSSSNFNPSIGEVEAKSCATEKSDEPYPAEDCSRLPFIRRRRGHSTAEPSGQVPTAKPGRPTRGGLARGSEGGHRPASQRGNQGEISLPLLWNVFDPNACLS